MQDLELEELKDDYRDKLDKFTGKYKDLALSTPADEKFKPPYNQNWVITYSNHRDIFDDKDIFDGNKIDEFYFLRDYPDEWIPDYNYLHREFSKSIFTGIEYYNPLQELSEEEMTHIFKTSTFQDFFLILLSNEITGGEGPSYIEIKTVAFVLNEYKDKTKWDFMYWSDDIVDKSSVLRPHADSIIRNIDNEANNIRYQSYNLQAAFYTLDPFYDGVRATPYVVEMFNQYLANPEDKAVIVERYKSLTNLPLVSLWAIINDLENFRNSYMNDYNHIKMKAYLLQAAYRYTVYHTYLVCIVRDLIESFKKAYPKGYFKNTKSAMSAK